MTLTSSRQNRIMGAGKQGGREAFKNKQTSDSVSTQEPGSEAAGTPIQAVITPFSTPRVARPQTHPPATFSDQRQKLAEVRETSGDQRLFTFHKGPSRRAGRTSRVPGLARPALARPPPPTPSPWENSERLPYQEQEAEDAPADHQLGRRRRHLRFRSG